jgi:hypothetical protein
MRLELLLLNECSLGKRAFFEAFSFACTTHILYSNWRAWLWRMKSKAHHIGGMKKDWKLSRARKKRWSLVEHHVERTLGHVIGGMKKYTLFCYSGKQREEVLRCTCQTTTARKGEHDWLELE